MNATPVIDELERVSDFSKHTDLAELLARARQFERQSAQLRTLAEELLGHVTHTLERGRFRQRLQAIQ